MMNKKSAVAIIMITEEAIDSILECFEKYASADHAMSVDDLVQSICVTVGKLIALGGRTRPTLLRDAILTLHASYDNTITEIAHSDEMTDARCKAS